MTKTDRNLVSAIAKVRYKSAHHIDSGFLIEFYHDMADSKKKNAL